MPQLHFTVDEQTAKRIEHEARVRGVSISKYLASQLALDKQDRWPAGYLEQVIGSCKDQPLIEPEELPLDDIAIE